MILPAAALVALLAVATVFQLKWRLVAIGLGIPQPTYRVVIEKNVMVSMRDGVQLAADLYRPDADGAFPVIVSRIPYGRAEPRLQISLAGGLFASQGFVFVAQDVRGKHDSEGTYYPYIHEAEDGHDTIQWAGTQRWSNGRVGTYGFSYFGSTQWLAAPQRSPHLKAMVPIVTGQNPYRRWIHDGVFRWNDVLVWHMENRGRKAEKRDDIDWASAVRHLPLIEADDAIGHDVPAYNDWIRNPTTGPYWDRINVEGRVSDIRAPALIIEGWYDYYLDLAIEDYNRMRKKGGTPEARRSRLLIGPWTHETTSEFEDRDFGGEASFLGSIEDILRWYRHWLLDLDDGAEAEKPIKLFVMGSNQWRSEAEWPLERTRWTRLYLHSDGKANTRNGDGRLSQESPGKEPFDRYVYDPDDPVPSVGGTSIYGDAEPGPVDQAAVEQREDVLVYSTPPLDEAVEVTGPVRLVLYASSSSVDTDFVATLVDVDPEGKALNLKTGIVRARFRNSAERPAFLTPGRVYEFVIEIGATSNLFEKGHRIRLQVTSSCFPEFSRNLNTGAPIGLTSERIEAEQRVFHEADFPSALVLPVIPRMSSSP
jgi:putative CocE/NonD family hydrolase